MKLSIRAATPEDAHFINRLWDAASDADLERLGELGRPDKRRVIDFMRELCATPFDPKTAVEDIRFWCIDGETVGYSTLKAIDYPNTAQIHLHMLRDSRRKGYGSILFCLSALEFINNFSLQTLYCQPKSDNPMPNGMLRKIGFKNLGSVTMERSDQSVVAQTRYLIDRETIRRYLATD